MQITCKVNFFFCYTSIPSWDTLYWNRMQVNLPKPFGSSHRRINTHPIRICLTCAMYLSNEKKMPSSVRNVHKTPCPNQGNFNDSATEQLSTKDNNNSDSMKPWAKVARQITRSFFCSIVSDQIQLSSIVLCIESLSDRYYGMSHDETKTVNHVTCKQIINGEPAVKSSDWREDEMQQNENISLRLMDTLLTKCRAVETKCETSVQPNSAGIF